MGGGQQRCGPGPTAESEYSPTVVSIPRLTSNLAASLGDRNSLGASFRTTIPSSFLSLRYTGIVSSNMFFTAKVSSQTISPNRPLW